MVEKTKIFIIIGLVGILVISIFISLQIYNAKKTIEREKNSLKSENETLSQKIEELRKEGKQLQEKISALNSDLDKIAQEKETLQKEKEEIQRQYETIAKERDELKEKLKTSAVTREGGKEAGATREDAYWAEILKIKTDLSIQVENLRQELNTLQMDNEQLRKELASLTREKQDLQQQLSYNQKMFDNLSSQLILEKGAKFRFEDELKPIKDENAILRQQLKDLSTQKIELDNQLRQLQEEKSELERQLNEITLFLQDRVSRSKALGFKERLEITPGQKESVELPPIAVPPQRGIPPQAEMPLLEEKGRQIYVGGSVLWIDKENNFVVIDLGQNADIKLGDTFQVYRKDKAIATIEVIEVRENISACDITEESMPIEVGDTVR